MTRALYSIEHAGTTVATGWRSAKKAGTLNPSDPYADDLFNPMPPIRILLANHHPIIRSSLRSLLEREPEFRVIAEAANGREAVVLANYKHPEIILLEVALPHLNGIAAAREIAMRDGLSKTVFVTAHTDECYVGEAFRAGARGYVMADAAPADLVPAIHAVANGRLFLSPAMSRHFLGGPAQRWAGEGAFSEYQKELCCLLAAGYDRREMALRLQKDILQLQADFQTVNDALDHLRVPEVLVKSIRENQRLTERA